MPSLSELAIIPLSVQAVLYGLYLASLVHCLRWLIFDDQGWNPRARRHINWSMLATTIVIFSLLTVDLVLELRMAIGPALKVDIVEYERQNVIVRAISNSGRLIFDAALIHRCWVIHAKSWRVNCPSLILWLSSLASFIALVYYNTTLAYTTDITPALTPSNQIYEVLLLFYSCNIATTIYVTAAIMYQLVQITKDNEIATSARLCYILVDSGALYTLTSAVVLVSVAVDAEFSFAKSLFRAVSGTINFSMAGISLNLILIRVCQSRTSSNPISSVLDWQSTNIMSSLQFYVSHYPSEEQSVVSVVLSDEEQTDASKKSHMPSVT